MGDQEITRSAERVTEGLKRNDSQAVNREVYAELFRIEQSNANPSTKAAREQQFFNELLKNDKELQEHGFPTLTLTQKDEKIRLVEHTKDGHAQDGGWVTAPSYTEVYGRANKEITPILSGTVEEKGSRDSQTQQLAENGNRAALSGHERYPDYPRYGTETGTPGLATYDNPYAQTHLESQTSIDARAGQMPRNTDGSVNLNALDQMPGGRLYGHQEQLLHWGPANAYSATMRTDLSLPASAVPELLRTGQTVAGRLSNGDPVYGRLRRYPDGNIHFDGVSQHSFGMEGSQKQDYGSQRFRISVPME